MFKIPTKANLAIHTRAAFAGIAATCLLENDSAHLRTLGSTASNVKCASIVDLHVEASGVQQSRASVNRHNLCVPGLGNAGALPVAAFLGIVLLLVPRPKEHL